jgi:NAD(P)-dependent dehydrogenase (short-subunit alcohol dehydrogenase family)
MTNDALFDVRGSVTVITGGASGLGLAAAEAMTAGGAKVTLIDHAPHALAKAVRGLSTDGQDVDGIEADVTDTGALAQAFDRVAAKHGRIDVVFANAGIGGRPGFLTGDGSRNAARQFEDLPAEQWDQVMAVNLAGAFNTVQTAAHHMKSNQNGKIAETSSISAYKAEQFVGTPYVVSKAGVAQIVRQAALELAGYGITVNAMAPGPFITNISGGRLKDADARAVFERNIPLRRLGEPGDIKGLVLFLASKASDYMTGAHLVIDGGFSLGFAD